MNPLVTLILFPFMPRKVALAHARTPLAWVFLIHLLGLVLLAGVLLALDSNFNRFHFVRGVLSSREDAAIAAMVLLGGELTFPLVALIMMCWAGNDEPVMETWRYSMRVSWLYISHLCWVAGGVGVLANTIAPSPTPTPIALVIIPSMVGIVTWSIISYLRALTVCRKGSPEPNDPMCEWCGYSLFQLGLDGLCPECGTRIGDSLNGQRAPLEFRSLQWGIISAWIGAERFLRSINANARSARAIGFFTIAEITTVIASGASLAGTLWVIQGGPSATFLIMVPLVALAAGMFTAWCYFMFASAVGTFAGIVASRMAARNRMTAGLQVVMLLSPVFPCWSASAIAAGIWAQNFFRYDPLVPLVWLVINTTIAAWFVSAVARRMKFVQYANR